MLLLALLPLAVELPALATLALVAALCVGLIAYEGSASPTPAPASATHLSPPPAPPELDRGATEPTNPALLDFGGGLPQHAHSYPNPDEGGTTMDSDQKKEQEQEDDPKLTEDLEVGEEAENVTGGLRRSDPDAGTQRA